MAPKVCVPADFGRHHIGAPSHGNLTFNLQEGLQIKANSIILSLNSPVIDDLTTNLHLTSLEAEDLSREAVDCFIEASYTGEVEALNQGNFRDVNKMSVVFKVDWLVARCEEYFVSYLDKLNSESSYPDILYAVEEAVYLLSVLKKKDFLNLVVKKMNSISNVRRNSFVNQYLSDLSGSTVQQIDACIAIVDTDVHVLVELLITHIEKDDKACLDENRRYLLEKLDLNICHKNRSNILDKLYSVLENVDYVQKEDYKLLLTKLRHHNAYNPTTAPIAMGEFASVKLASLAPCLTASCLKEAIDMLVASDLVDNLYKLIDGIWLRTRQCADDTVDHTLIEKLVRIKEQKKWKKVDYQYVRRLFVFETAPICTKFIELLKNCKALVSRSTERCYASTRDYHGYKFIQEVFEKDNNFFFRFENSEFADQHFILSTTASKRQNPDSFSMKWGALNSHILPNQSPKLHFALERWKNGEWSNIFPITWWGKPTCIQTGESWAWGCLYHNVSSKNIFQKLAKGSDELVFWDPCIGMVDANRYRFIIFVV